MAKPTEIDTAPILPAASVDFNKLHDAIKKGSDSETAVAAAIIAMPDAEPVDEPAAAPDAKAPATAS